jgi:hypothetical protein
MVWSRGLWKLPVNGSRSAHQPERFNQALPSFFQAQGLTSDCKRLATFDLVFPYLTGSDKHRFISRKTRHLALTFTLQNISKVK